MTNGADEQYDDDEQDYDDEVEQDGLPDASEAVFDFDTTARPARRQKRERPWQVFTIDGHPVRVRQPKGAFFIRLAEVFANGSDLAQAAAMDDVLDKVFDQPSAEHVRERLDDDEDDFDVDDLGDILNRLRELWSSSTASGRRPTGRATSSSGRPPRSGRSSSARSRTARG